MQVKVRFLDNLRLEASFDDFTVISDQPIRYKGDGRTYKIDVRMGRSSVAHRAEFKTDKNSKGWQIVKIPFATCRPLGVACGWTNQRFKALAL